MQIKVYPCVITNPGARNEREQLKTKLNTMTGTIRFYEKDKVINVKADNPGHSPPELKDNLPVVKNICYHVDKILNF